MSSLPRPNSGTHFSAARKWPSVVLAQHTGVSMDGLTREWQDYWHWKDKQVQEQPPG